MVEWLKELSIFDHFLHGLFKYLNESTTKPNSLPGIEGSNLTWVKLSCRVYGHSLPGIYSPFAWLLATRYTYCEGRQNSHSRYTK